MKQILNPRFTVSQQLLFISIWICLPCRAELIHFDFDEASPILLSVDGSLTYDRVSGRFHSQTVPLTYNSMALPSGFVFFSGSVQTVIDLFVDDGGAFVSSGMGVRVTGSLDFDEDGTDDVSGDDADPLLSGPVTAFGAEGPGPPTRAFNGLYEIQGGKLTADIPLSGGGQMFGGFPVGGDPGGFIVFAENVTGGTLGDFSQDFSSDGVKDNVGVTPEPSCLALAAAATAAALGYFRKRACE